ncbi:stalk domain-containing protein [Paenibacillus sp.]|uniref:stalk domain-containing protein n=1 Tax=Paenibacillus sp. TaxID=58172 RepID=UPI0028122B3B|nr:stalk domain-containing protein [Paenibacillus sp.]
MKKWGIIASLVAVSVVSASIGATAATGIQEVKAYLNMTLNLKLAGDSWAPLDGSGNRVYPITYNGTTYLPVRAVGEAMGVNIGFDTATNTVLIGGGAASGTTAGASSVSKGVGYSRTNPAPLGTVLSFNGERVLTINFDGKMSVSEVIRGEEAWEIIREANMYNDEPPAGHEYLLAKINIDVTKTVKDGAVAVISPVWFTLVSTAGKDYEDGSAFGLEPKIRAALYEGASHTGWASFIVKTDDPSPAITFNRDDDGSGGIWFKTN